MNLFLLKLTSRKQYNYLKFYVQTRNSKAVNLVLYF